MSEIPLFEEQHEVVQADCDLYAQKLMLGSLKPVPWQGSYSYTLSSDSGRIIQFRSQASPLDETMSKLAKEVHGHLAPATIYRGCMPNSSLTIWEMEALPGKGHPYSIESLTPAKQDATVVGLAKWVSSHTKWIFISLYIIADSMQHRGGSLKLPPKTDATLYD